jgi:alpha-beta hydrolase superfamily lysophospholipase
VTRFKAYRLAHRFKLPIFIAQGGHDLFMDKTATEMFSRKACDVTYQFYPQMFHGISIDLDREKVFNDVLTWLKSL